MGNLPQILVALFMVISLVLRLGEAQHYDTPRTRAVKTVSALLGTTITNAILYWGGWWDCWLK